MSVNRSPLIIYMDIYIYIYIYIYIIILEYKYYGHIRCNTMKDLCHISREYIMIYSQGNNMRRKFNMCSEDVNSFSPQTFVVRKI